MSSIVASPTRPRSEKQEEAAEGAAAGRASRREVAVALCLSPGVAAPHRRATLAAASQQRAKGAEHQGEFLK